MSERFEAYPSGPEFLLVILAALILISAGIWLILNADTPSRYDPNVARAIGALCVVSFSTGFIELFLVMAAPGPLIAIGPDGVMWHFWSKQTIPWDAIERIQVRRSTVQSYIAIELRDGAQYPPRAIRLPVALISRLFGYSGIPFSNKIADTAFEPMLDAMRQHAPELFSEKP